ncbi:MAG: hypothetical protein K0R12_1354 [Gammaproteobacteria bacterium]|jgi:DNA processing protein|nr:hypothetical protein [Gammaproteobacteria bacterium]
MPTLREWIALANLPPPQVSLYHYLKNQGIVQALFDANQTLLPLTNAQRHYLHAPPWDQIDRSLEIALQHQWHILTIEDSRYPEPLKHIADPPLLLFANGELSLLQTLQIAIVGSRHPTIDGLTAAYEFAKNLSDRGFIITSGLAKGIDTAAHQGALASRQSSTLAVMATGLDRIYPTSNQRLSEQILKQNGLLLPEFLPKTPAYAHHFPRRNRIISGLSSGVFVIEAALQSGSLITARFAAEQGREVFALPGSIHNPLTKGCHHLLREGAQLVETVDDIVQNLQHLLPKALQGTKNEKKLHDKRLNTVQSLDSNQALLLECIGYQATPVDQIIARSALPAAKVATLLTDLVLLDQIKLEPNGYCRCR